MKDTSILIIFGVVVALVIFAERITRPKRMSAEEFDDSWNHVWDNEDPD